MTLEHDDEIQTFFFFFFVLHVYSYQYSSAVVDLCIGISPAADFKRETLQLTCGPGKPTPAGPGSPCGGKGGVQHSAPFVIEQAINRTRYICLKMFINN